MRKAVESPLADRVLFVTGVVAGLYLALGIARALRVIPPELWILLEAPLSEGAVTTIAITASVIPVGAIVGFFVGWARVTRHPILTWTSTAYVNVVRGIPPLVMIFFAFFWLPFVLLPRRETFQAGLTLAVLALAAHTSAYQAEIFRAGFQSIPRGQIEAAESLGLRRWQIMRLVVLPQAFRVTLPALGNEFANVVKDTTLLAAIGATDLAFWGRNNVQYAFGQLEWVFTMWIVIAIFYFIITYIITQTVAAVEHHYRVPGLGSVSF